MKESFRLAMPVPTEGKHERVRLRKNVLTLLIYRVVRPSDEPEIVSSIGELC